MFEQPPGVNLGQAGSRNFVHIHTGMPQTGLIENAHNDLVTDAAYDFYGLRLATCSLDQRSVYHVQPHALVS